jgi:hypothetical protein
VREEQLEALVAERGLEPMRASMLCGQPSGIRRHRSAEGES